VNVNFFEGKMSADDLTWPVIFSQGTLIRYEPTTDQDRGQSVYFGGPLQMKSTGVSYGPEPLHRLLTFPLLRIPQPAGMREGGWQGVFYGMRYDGCSLSYRRHDSDMGGDSHIHVTQMRCTGDAPRVGLPDYVSRDDWPYENYPKILPYLVLKELSRESMSFDDFERNCTIQGLEWCKGDELVVIIPSHFRLGVSLWGPFSDESVQIIASYNFHTKEMYVTNQCY
jgi:hypothetical protein